MEKQDFSTKKKTKRISLKRDKDREERNKGKRDKDRDGQNQGGFEIPSRSSRRYVRLPEADV